MMFMLLDEAWQQSIVDTVNMANLSQDDEDWKEVGYFAGAIVSQLLEFQVPSTSFVFGESLITEVISGLAAGTE